MQPSARIPAINADPAAVSFQPTSVALDAILQATIGQLASAALAKHIDIELTQDEPVFVSGDAGLLEILFRNLIDNAIRYSPPSTIVNIEITAGEAAALIRIRDAGPGISAEQRANVGCRFYRAPGTHAPGRTGLIDRAANHRSAPRHNAARVTTDGRWIAGQPRAAAYAQRAALITATGGPMLFSERSIWTMVHGIGLGGTALLALAAALFYLYATRPASGSTTNESGSPAFAVVTTFAAVMLWLTVIVGTYIVFPTYRATPPPGTTDLSHFPRALILANANTAWLHAFAMEIKEHMPWIASMLTTAVAFVAVRRPGATLRNPAVRGMAFALLAISFAIVALVSLLGMFVNKVAPLE